MSVNTYETMFLIDSNKYASDPQGSIGEVTKILERVGAKTLAERPWLDGKLAYLVEGRRKGLHYLVYVEMEGQQLAEMTRLCKLSDIVLRHLVIKLDPSLVEPMLAVVSGEKPVEEAAPTEEAIAGETTTEPAEVVGAATTEP